MRGQRPNWGISIHALLAESDQLYINRAAKTVVFLSTLSLRRATCRIPLSCAPIPAYFYPRSPCGERQRKPTSISARTDFYPRSPCGERRGHGYTGHRRVLISIHALLAESDFTVSFSSMSSSLFLSTLSLRRATKVPLQLSAKAHISIHALLAESDPGIQRLVALLRQFLSTLSLRRATRLAAVCYDYYSIGFLSTLSLRRATHPHTSNHPHNTDFYPRSPCGERQRFQAVDISARRISIHALLAESDLPINVMSVSAVQISIHALLAESDWESRTGSAPGT